MQQIIEYGPEPNEPFVGAGGINNMPPFRIISATIEATGRSISGWWSQRDGRPVLGVDVAQPQKWYDELNTWKGWAAGGSHDGTKLETAFKKSPHVSEGPDYALWLAGSNGSGGIYRRAPGGRWSLRTTSFWGFADDGGSADPRRAGGKLAVYMGNTCFLACSQASGDGIARSTDGGLTWTAWLFSTDRNYTSLVRSPQYDHIYACADGRGAASTDGVFRISGLTGTASVERMDTAGTANPGGMVDLRCLAVGREGTTDIILVVCGNRLGGDADRGLWRVRCIPTFSSAPGGATNIPPPRQVTTRPEAAARILGYIFGDGNPDQTGSPLAGGTHLTTIIPPGEFKNEALRCCGVLGWTVGVDYRLSGPNQNLQVSKASLVAGLNYGGVSAYTTSDDLYYGALTGDVPTRLQVQAFLASVIETEGQAGSQPPKVFDDARGGAYDARIDAMVATLNTPVAALEAFRSGVACRCNNTLLSGFPLPLISTARYPGTTLADWPEDPSETGEGGTITGFTYQWEHVYTPGTNDNMQAVELWRPDGEASTGRTHCVVQYFDSNDNSSGTYTLSADAGGTTQNFKESITRLLNVDQSAGSVVKEVLSIGGNVSQQTIGTNHIHVQSFTGEASVEQSILGGQSYSGQDIALHSDKRQLLIVGKNTPWYCPDIQAPLAQVRFYPMSKGCGALSGGVCCYQEPGTDFVYLADDDRGGYSVMGRYEHGPIWVAADDVHGFTAATGSNTANSVDPCLTTPGSLLTARANGAGYRIDTPKTHGSVTLFSGVTDTGNEALRFFEFVDGGATTRNILVTRARFYRNGTSVFTVSNSDSRASWHSSGNTVWIFLPTKGIYRSTDAGATWVLWWSKTISATQGRWFGHMVADPDVPNTLYIAFDNGGIWKIANAHTAANGSGTAGSVPTGAAKITGGTMASGTIIGPLAWDDWNNDLWAIEMPVDGTGSAKFHCLRNGAANFESFEYEEMDEGGAIVQYMTAIDGELQLMTAGMGTLRRMM